MGYELVLFNGTNAGKRAREIFEEWQLQFPKEAEEGSKSINLRKALVWKFQNIEKGILITTEAEAEGLNLQFANIVINYDLPDNPDDYFRNRLYCQVSKYQQHLQPPV